MNSNSCVKGFSLIELLVVLMIMTLITSLVGPSINKVYSQHMAQQEVRLLQQYVRDVSLQAFHKHQEIELHLEGNALTAIYRKNTPEIINSSSDISKMALAVSGENVEQVLEQEFDYLHFENAVFRALKNGLVTQDLVKVSVGSVGIIKDISVRGIAFTEYWQVNE